MVEVVVVVVVAVEPVAEEVAVVVAAAVNKTNFHNKKNLRVRKICSNLPVQKVVDHLVDTDSMVAVLDIAAAHLVVLLPVFVLTVVDYVQANDKP